MRQWCARELPDYHAGLAAVFAESIQRIRPSDLNADTLRAAGAEVCTNETAIASFDAKPKGWVSRNRHGVDELVRAVLVEQKKAA